MTTLPIETRTAAWKPPTLTKSLARTVAKRLDKHWAQTGVKSLQDIRSALGSGIAAGMSMSDRIDHQAAIQKWTASLSKDDLHKAFRMIEEIKNGKAREQYRMTDDALNRLRAASDLLPSERSASEREAEKFEAEAQAAQAQAEADRQKADASRLKEGAGGLYGYTKGTQRDVEASIRKAQRRAASVAKTLYAKDERSVDFLKAHAKRANSKSARLILAAMRNIGPRVASDKTARPMSRGAQRLLAQLQANPDSTLPLKEATWLGSRRWDHANVLGNLGLVEWAPGGRGLMLTSKGRGFRAAADKTAAPDYEWWDKNGRSFKSKTTRALRMVQRDPKKALKMAEELYALMDKHGYPDNWHRVQRLKEDAEHEVRMQSSKWASETLPSERHASIFHGSEKEQLEYVVDALRLAGNQGLRVDGLPRKGALAAQSKGFAEAERGRLYITSAGKSVRMASEEKVAGGLYGHPTKTARLALVACSDLRAYVGEVAYSLHSRRTAKYARMTGFLKEHGKTAKCAYSRMILDCYPDAPVSKQAGVKDWRDVKLPRSRKDLWGFYYGLHESLERGNHDFTEPLSDVSDADLKKAVQRLVERVGTHDQFGVEYVEKMKKQAPRAYKELDGIMGGKLASSEMLKKAFVPDSVDGWLEWADGTRTASPGEGKPALTSKQQEKMLEEIRTNPKHGKLWEELLKHKDRRA